MAHAASDGLLPKPPLRAAPECSRDVTTGRVHEDGGLNLTYTTLYELRRIPRFPDAVTQQSTWLILLLIGYGNVYFTVRSQ